MTPSTGRRGRLGAVVDGSATTFSVDSGGEAVELCLYDDDGAERRLPMHDAGHGRWERRVEEAGPGTAYGYRVHGPWDPWHGHRFNPAKLLLDPYARAIDGSVRLAAPVFGHVTVDGGASPVDDTAADHQDSAPFVPRSVVVSGGFDWRGDQRPRVPWDRTVIYEAHVRGMTLRHPEVPERQRGTYAGLAHPAVIEHLVALGVTTVELLPVHAFVSEPFLVRRGRANHWGYNSVGFFAPHGPYSSSGTRGEQVTEFKEMVRALHAAGLEVVLDVVYNHTGESGIDGPTVAWRGLDNAAYYRLRHGRLYTDFTGCGNSLDLRQPSCLRMVTDSLRYWVDEMHVDGFRFDLAPTLARNSDAFDRRSAFLAVVGQDPVLSDVKLIAEPWDVGPGGYQLGAFPPPWAEWNDRYRDAVRQVWLADNARKQGAGIRDLAYRLSGSSDVFGPGGKTPLASVNFVTAHDGFTLRDLVTYEAKHNEPNGEDNRDGSDNNRSWNCGVEGPTDDPAVRTLRRRMMRNLVTTLLVSTGVPMLTAGDELGRTQHGNNNAYSVPIDPEDGTDAGQAGHPLQWENDDEASDLLSWLQSVLALRREHPVLRQDDFFDGRPASEGGRTDLAWFAPNGAEMTPEAWFHHDSRAVGFYLAGDGLTRGGTAAAGATDTSLLVLLNTGPEEVSFRLPGEPWATAYDGLLDTTDERPRAFQCRETAGEDVVLGPLSVRVLAAR